MNTMTKDLRKAFESANAINALSGYLASDADLALQERVIRGEITFDDAVREVIEAAKQSSQS